MATKSNKSKDISTESIASPKTKNKDLMSLALSEEYLEGPPEKPQNKITVRKAQGTTEMSKEENDAYIEQTLFLLSLDPVKFDSAVNVRNRVKLYFQNCKANGLRPVLPGLEIALGIDDDTWMRYLYGDMGSDEVIREFKKAEQMLQHQASMWVAAGKIAPVAGIFNLKTYHHRTEDQEYSPNGGDLLGRLRTQEELEKKYEGIDLTFSDVKVEEIGLEDMVITDTPERAEREKQKNQNKAPRGKH